MLRHLVQQYKALEHNVRLTYVYTVFFWSSRSIILDQVLAGYIYVLTGSNEPVGMVTGINGLVRILVTFPAGYASDRFRRDTVLKFAGGLGLLCAMLSVSAYISGHMVLLYVAYACWGGYFAIQRPATEALFADSIPNGQREGPMTIKYILMNVAGALGPIASIVFFYLYGDSWSLSGLEIVLCGGMVVGLPGLIVLFFFNDDLAYENSTRRAERLSVVEDGELSDIGDDRSATKERSLLLQNDDESALGDTVNTFYCLGPRHIPTILFVTDFIMYNGGGMSISFFPLFFQNEYGLTPAQVNTLFVIQPALIVLLTSAAQRYSARFGDIESVVVTRIFASMVLLSISYARDHAFLDSNCIHAVFGANPRVHPDGPRPESMARAVECAGRADDVLLLGQCHGRWFHD
ncbi:hypothetical protein, variant 1 [Aphanomyces invadans]|uniref:Major facilitator superfamily (MFS) profile domain-containing protein n=1 Tax=Aphanomyces invadans TaxID=157072 RepID=A0A024TZI7_9STRA|nr:hypothetical protein, variant 1 [Aphanomyces invadans]ETV99061.1 hypothetical protein, variant 1 [Aphanomyces invadans]|eukprot:XP_008872488.1 hypothetical protein, variant 1 [Aphanomyces invadans]